MAAPFPSRLAFERDMGRDSQFHFGTGRGAAADPQASADAPRTLAHARHTPMPFPAGGHPPRVDAAAVVAHEHAQLLRRIFQFDLNMRRARMTEGVEQG